MHCKACDAPMSYSHIDDAFDAEGNPVLEFCCNRCRTKAFQNEPEEYYEGLWLNRNGHPSHHVLLPYEEYLL